jgi:hypothetical protein
MKPMLVALRQAANTSMADGRECGIWMRKSWKEERTGKEQDQGDQGDVG